MRPSGGERHMGPPSARPAPNPRARARSARRSSAPRWALDCVRDSVIDCAFVRVFANLVDDCCEAGRLVGRAFIRASGFFVHYDIFGRLGAQSQDDRAAGRPRPHPGVPGDAPPRSGPVAGRPSRTASVHDSEARVPARPHQRPGGRSSGTRPVDRAVQTEPLPVPPGRGKGQIDGHGPAPVSRSVVQ